MPLRWAKTEVLGSINLCRDVLVFRNDQNHMSARIVWPQEMVPQQWPITARAGSTSTRTTRPISRCASVC